MAKMIFSNFYLCLILLLSIFAFILSAKSSISIESTLKSDQQNQGIRKINDRDKSLSSQRDVYKWIDPRNESLLIKKMDLKKKEISPSSKVNPPTQVTILNLSSRTEAELDIYDGEKRPFYYFSETYITPPLYIYSLRDCSVFFDEDTRKILVFKNGYYTLLGRENSSSERIVLKLIEKEKAYYDEITLNIYLPKNLLSGPAVKGKTVLFHGDWNLYHVIMEPAAALVLTNYLENQVNLSYLSEQNTEVLKALGNPNFVSTELYTFKNFAELEIASPIHENNAHFPNIPLMKKLLKILKKYNDQHSKVHPIGKNIYISRADAQRRRVLNEEKLIKELKKRGFKVVSPGMYSVADQAKLFEEAQIVVAPHGLGLVNILFSDNLETLIELLPISHYPNCYLRIAQIKGAKNYIGIIHDAEGQANDWLSDFYVNIPEILRVLDGLKD